MHGKNSRAGWHFPPALGIQNQKHAAPPLWQAACFFFLSSGSVQPFQRAAAGPQPPGKNPEVRRAARWDRCGDRAGSPVKDRRVAAVCSRPVKSRGAQCVPARDPKILFFFFLCTFRMRSCSRRAGHSAYSAVMPAIDWASSSSALMLSSPSSASTSLTQATISASPFLQATQLPLLSYSMPMSAMTRSSCTAA